MYMYSQGGRFGDVWNVEEKEKRKKKNGKIWYSIVVGQKDEKGGASRNFTKAIWVKMEKT